MSDVYRDFIRYAALKASDDPRLRQTLSMLPKVKWPKTLPPTPPSKRLVGAKEFDPHRSRFRGLLWRAQEGHCAWCGEKMRLSASSLDHVHPLALGGLNWIGNLLLMHQACNEEKADSPPERDLREMLEVVNEWLAKEVGGAIFNAP